MLASEILEPSDFLGFQINLLWNYFDEIEPHRFFFTENFKRCDGVIVSWGACVVGQPGLLG